MFFVVFTTNKISFWNLFYFTPYLNCYTRFHPSQLHNKGQITTFSSIIKRKHYVCFTRLLKISLFSFERRLAIHTKKICKEIEKNCKLQEFYASFYDWQSYKLRLVLGGYFAWLNRISLNQTSWSPSSNHANVWSNILTLNNQVLRAETIGMFKTLGV